MPWRWNHKGALPFVYLPLVSSLSYHMPKPTGPGGGGEETSFWMGTGVLSVSLTVKVEPGQ